MSTAIVTTTIHTGSRLERWARQLGPGDYLIVATDRKTPRDELRLELRQLGERFGFEALFVHDVPGSGAATRLSEVVGWNTIQRRNLATLVALGLRTDVVFTVDDDNFPARDDHVARVGELLTELPKLSVVSTRSGWYNVGRLLDPPVTHRGYPLSRRHQLDTPIVGVPARTPVRVGVHASLWLDDPDIDAVERIARDPRTSWPGRVDTIALAPDTWCPFNSQATAYSRDCAPLLCVPPGLGRYDDIWGSYVARRIMDRLGYHVAYGQPLVFQDRNEHDPVRDLEQELYGMRHTDEFVRHLREEVELTGTNVIDCLGELCDQLSRLDRLLPAQTREFLALWPTAVEEAVGA